MFFKTPDCLTLTSGLMSSMNDWGENQSTVKQLRQQLFYGINKIQRLFFHLRISEAIDLMNGIDLSKFSKFVIRIADKLDENFDQIFSDEEEAKLIPILVVSDIRHVKLIVKTVHYLLRQIVYHLMKPRVIAKELTELGLDTEKVVAFAEICSTHLPAIVDRFKDKSFDISNSRLTDVNWSVKLLTNQSCRQYKDVVPLAQLDLTLKTNGQTDNHLSLDLDRKELWNLYENLEAIQTQLDSLYK